MSLLMAAFGTLFGLSTAGITGVLDRVVSDLSLTRVETQTLVAAMIGGCLIGSMLASPLAARAGRRPALLLAAGGAVPGFVLMATAPDYLGLLAGRILVGLGVGLSSTVAPMYAAEASPARHRGAVVSTFQLAITAGILLAYGGALHWRDGPWQLLLGSGMLVAVGCIGSVLLLPESPRWLMARGHVDAARSAAIELALERELQAPDDAPTAGRDGVWGGSTGAVLAFCAALFMLQNLSGIDGIIYYAPGIFEQLGFSRGAAALAATFGLGLANFAATLLALRLVDRVGRRPLLVWGALAMTLGLGAALAASCLVLPWLGLAGLLIYIVAFAVSLGPLPFVLMSELLPRAIREQGMAAASAANWLCNVLVAFSFLALTDALGLPGVMALFAAVCAVTLAAALAFAPETRAVSLEAIEAQVRAGTPLRQLGQGRAEKTY